MGIIIGSLALITGLILILFPKAMSKFLRTTSSPRVLRKENDKWEWRTPRTIEEAWGERKAIIYLRVLGIIMFILSIFAFLSNSAP